jgi:hypothetical protein
VWSVARPPDPHVGLFDAIISIDTPPYTGLFGGVVTEPLRFALKQFELVIGWTARRGPPFLISDPYLERPAVEGPIRIFNPYPPPGIHAADWLLETLSLRWPEDLSELLRLSKSEQSDARRLLHGLGLDSPILLHPGAGAAWKRWPVERYAQLADQLSDEGFPIAVIEGPADQEATAEFRSLTTGAHPVLSELSVRSLASILANSALFIGNDSGVAHLAALAGAPVIALFGPTDPSNWAPIGNVSLLRGCTRQALYQGHIRCCDDPACMQRIRLEDVLASARNHLS